MTLDEFNLLPNDQASNMLLACCGSTAWAEKLSAQRPFDDIYEIEKTASRVWNDVSEAEWLMAFDAHPRIGGRTHSKWSAEEQSGTQDAQAQVLIDLEKGNDKYEAKFGFAFLICATGKNADEMLSALETRLQHRKEEEIQIAAKEQEKIMLLRIRKLLNS